MSTHHSRVLSILIGIVFTGYLIFVTHNHLIPLQLQATTQKAPQDKIIAMNGQKLLKKVPAINHKHIIFDMTGVLFDASRKFLISEIGIWNLIYYTVTHFKNPFNLSDKLYQVFLALNTEVTTKYRYKNKPLPKIIVEWQTGLKTSDDILQLLEEKIPELASKKFFASTMEQELVNVAARVFFSPKKLVDQSFKPAQHGIKILEAFSSKRDAQGNKLHKIYLLSNFDKDTFPLLKQRHPQIFKHFDDTMISGEVGYLKPDNEIFEALLEKHELDPQDCLFIDDQEENIQAAQNNNISGILYL